MRTIRLVGVGIALMLMSVAIGGGTVGAAGTITTITHGNMQGWAFEGPDEAHDASGIEAGAFVTGPSGGTGTGSAHFVLGNQAGGEFLATTQFAGTALGSFTTLSFDTYVTPDPTNPSLARSAALEFDIDYDPTAVCATLIRPTDPVGSCYQGRFVFIPAFNNGSQTVATNTWQTWNTLNPQAKDWYASHGVPNHPGMCTQAANAQCSMADLLAVYPNAAIKVRQGTGQFGVKAGSGYSNFDGNADNIKVNGTTFDFEPGGAPVTLNVRPDGEDSVCNGSANAAVADAVYPNCAFKTINGALVQSVAGDTIAVHQGTYAEQVNITKALTLTGDGAANTTIQVPAAPVSNVPSPNGVDTGYALVGVSNSATLTMSGLTLNGPWPFSSDCNPQFYGIFAYGSGTIAASNATISNIANVDQATAGGCQQGVGIQIGRNVLGEVGHATLTNVTVSGYQKNGITADAAGSSLTVSGSHITSAPSSLIASNGVQVSRGATGSITGNTISGNECNLAAGCTSDPVPADPNLSFATGIILFNPAAGLTIQGNTITNNDVGIDHYVPATDGNAISGASNTSHKKNALDADGTATSPQKNVVAVSNTPTTIAGNTLTGNRYEGIYLDEGTATVSGNSITGGNIGVEVASFGGETGNAQGTLSQNEITGTTVAGIQLQLDPTATFLAKISGDSNSIHDNAIGVNNTITTGTPLTMTNNYWGSANGPTNAINKFNVGSQGNSVSANVNFVPWWSTISGVPGSFTGTSFAPVTNTAPAGQFASIQAAETAATAGGTVNAAAGTFTESVTVDKALTINGAKRGVDARTNRGAASTETILTGGGFSLTADAITIDGFTVQNPGSTDKVGITLSAAHSGYQVLNNIIQNNTFGIYGNSQGTTQTQIKQNLIQHNNELGSASGNAIYADQGSANMLIDNNKFVDNVNGGAAGFFGTPGTQHDITFSNNNLDSDLDLVNITHATVSNNTSTNATGGSIIIIDGGNNGVTVTGNTITGGSGSAVVIVDRNSAGANQNIDIQNNTFTGNARGIQALAGGLTGTVPTVHGNTIANNSGGGVINQSSVTIDATNNWWGTLTGPAHASNVGGTGNSVTDGVTFTPWCGNIACTIHYGIGTKLVYITQPVGGPAGTALPTQPVVQAQDASGNLGINFAGLVALALGTNPSTATLGGTTTVNAVAGVATFTNVSVSKAGAGYTLVASSGSLTSATSNPFTVGASIPTVSSMNINTGTIDGGTTVVITGTNFVTGDTVTFGGVAATDVQVLSGTQISVKTPAHAEGLVDVRVVNANNQGNTLAQQYHYISAADVTVPGARPGPIGPAVGQPAPLPPVQRPLATPNPHP